MFLGMVVGVMQGMQLGIFLVVMSQVYGFQVDFIIYWEIVEIYGVLILCCLFDLKWLDDVFINVNFFDCLFDVVSEIEVMWQGCWDQYILYVQKCIDLCGVDYYWFGFYGKLFNLLEGVDLKVIYDGKILVMLFYMDLIYGEIFGNLKCMLGGVLFKF